MTDVTWTNQQVSGVVLIHKGTPIGLLLALTYAVDQTSPIVWSNQSESSAPTWTNQNIS